MKDVKKKVFRVGRVVTAEIYYKSGSLEIQLDSKDFNIFWGGFFQIDPTDKDWDNAHKWADEWIEQYQRKAHG